MFSDAIDENMIKIRAYFNWNRHILATCTALLFDHFTSRSHPLQNKHIIHIKMSAATYKLLERYRRLCLHVPKLKFACFDS